MLDTGRHSRQQDDIPVYKGIVDSEGQNEVNQLLLYLVVTLLAGGDLALLLSPEVERICCLAIHFVYVNLWCISSIVLLESLPSAV